MKISKEDVKNQNCEQHILPTEKILYRHTMM